MRTLTVTGNRPEYDAWHEGGHAAGYLAQGIVLGYVTIIGTVEMPRPHTQPVGRTGYSWGQKALISAGGLISGFRSNGWGLGITGVVDLLLGSADDRFELVGYNTGRRTRLPRGPIAAPHQDLSWINPPRPFTPAEALAFWDESEQFVEQVLSCDRCPGRSAACRGHRQRCSRCNDVRAGAERQTCSSPAAVGAKR
jgi:hypothetical protein